MNTQTIYKLANGKQLYFTNQRVIHTPGCVIENTIEITLSKPPKKSNYKKVDPALKKKPGPQPKPKEPKVPGKPGRPTGTKNSKLPILIDDEYRQRVSMLPEEEQEAIRTSFKELGMDINDDITLYTPTNIS